MYVVLVLSYSYVTHWASVFIFMPLAVQDFVSL